MTEQKLFIIFGVEHYNTLGLIRTLGSVGIQPIYIAIKGKAAVASKSKYVAKCHFVDTPEDGFRVLLDEYGDEYTKSGRPFLYCIDDKTISYLDKHYDELIQRFAFFNANAGGRINEFMDKYRILQIAEKHGLNILPTYCVERGVIPDGLSYPVITKSISPVVGGWKSDVKICHSEDDLKSAYQTIKAETVIIQQYIDKENEYCLEGISICHGETIWIPIEITYNYKLPDYYSPYMTVQNMNNPQITACLQEMFKEIGFEGLFEAEFLVDKDGKLFFSEVNFRNSPWSYSATVAGMPLAYLWAKGMDTGVIEENALKRIEKPFTAMVEPIDYQKRVVERGMDKGEWARQLLNCRCLYYYDSGDIEPFLEMVRYNEKLR